MSSAGKAKLAWARHRKTITKLWSEDGKELPEVREIMAKDYGFTANEKAYKRQFKKWDLDHKNVKREESMAILGIVKRRNKATVFKHYGKLVRRGNVRRFLGRYKKNPDFSPDVRAATPPGITYGTPEPDDKSKYILTPAVLTHSRHQRSSREEQALMGNTPRSHSFDGDGSSQSGTAPWEASPESFSGLSADFYPGTEQPSQTNMTADLRNTLSGHQQPYELHAFAQTNASSGFARRSWGEPTEPPSHAYHAPGYGNPWVPHPQPPQPLQQAMHSLNPSPNALAFQNHCSPGLDYGVIGTTQFNNANQGQTTIGIPEAPSRDMLLYSAVVGGDVNRAGALLLDGADPNFAAHGGVTPLHCAAYQKNVDMVKLLIGYCANFEAKTENDQSILFFAVSGQGQSGCIDMPGYGIPTQMGNGLHTDENALRTIGALFECATRLRLPHSNVDKSDKDGVTPLMVAAGEGFLETAAMLLRHGAQPGQQDHANHTALKYAALNRHRGMVRFLLTAGPAVLYPEISHILELASKNITGGRLRGGGGRRSSWERRYDSADMLIAEEIVRQCRQLGVLNQLLSLAKQNGQSAVFECLRRAMAQPRSAGSRAAEP
ncbi:predicted protein [Chaetomium globosum CBS 148.51]|uniref:Clr5 domain-containing protein n=1 Tax=Chaetomium globosum (strain ATCC 6205 / CBS 148.51 / DSM 1962 / NBRC 6347 / NRRL 1970) TaxID=306901 RepID=Q2H7K1_CHAGB|nr:uncharacterized protein CHGG_05364 [Chaetomium globosum CBS 148.51]EAQ88745.1 predicted protein [Chaetomium globosum CBS 148.51]